MKEKFRFRNPGKLIDGDLELVLVKKIPANPSKKYVPCYQFEMRKIGGTGKIGRISLRVGSARSIRCPGHVGYSVNKRSRGKRYAARSLRLLFPLALAHGMKAIWITCNPKNHASRRTCELAGARHIETVRTPKEHELYALGMRVLMRHRIDRKTMSNKALQRTR
jgi:predicted acetyltransferase